MRTTTTAAGSAGGLGNALHQRVDQRPWLIMLSGSAWAVQAHRQQALAAELAGAHRVLYVDPPDNFRRGRFSIRRVRDSLWHATAPTAIPLGGQIGLANLLSRRMAARKLREWLNDHPGERLLWIDDDLAYPMIGHLGELGAVCDATDLAWTFTQPWNRPYRKRSLRSAIGRADLVLASSSALPSRLPATRRPVVVLTNACDAERFSPSGPRASWLSTVRRPLLGYLGAIDVRALDSDLVAQVARQHPEWTFVLVGPSTKAGRKPLRNIANVHLFPAVSYAEAPAVVRAFDVGLIPYRVGGLIDYVHPKKCYEYLAAGKPVVGTRLPALVALGNSIEVAAGATDFGAAIARALESADNPVEIAERRSIGAANSWHDRGDRLRSLLDDLVAS